MDELIAFVTKSSLKILFVFTPFLILSIFLGITDGYDAPRRRAFAMRATTAVAVTCFTVYFFGTVIFSLFGITLDAFRIGAGALLFLNAVNLVQGRAPITPMGEHDSAVVPFALPIIVGPAVIGVLMVLGADATDAGRRVGGAVAIALAIISLGCLLLLATQVERIIGKAHLRVMSKVTGLILAAMSAQMIFAGIRQIMLTPQ